MPPLLLAVIISVCYYYSLLLLLSVTVTLCYYYCPFLAHHKCVFNWLGNCSFYPVSMSLNIMRHCLVFAYVVSHSPSFFSSTWCSYIYSQTVFSTRGISLVSPFPTSQFFLLTLPYSSIGDFLGQCLTVSAWLSSLCILPICMLVFGHFLKINAHKLILYVQYKVYSVWVRIACQQLLRTLPYSLIYHLKISTCQYWFSFFFAILSFYPFCLAK